MKIAIAAEIVPAKTMVPVIKRLKEQTEAISEELEIISLVHGNGAREILEPYSSEIHSIGQGRRSDGRKRNPIELTYLILKDIAKATNSIRGKGVDILITSGNAGDVRKGLAAANILGIPTIHLEQDIYNPIELISHANLVATTSSHYVEYLANNYNINNPQNINGYPMATYINEELSNYDNNIDSNNNCNADKSDDNIIDNNVDSNNCNVTGTYGVESDFILLVLGGDLKREDLPNLFSEIRNIILSTNYNILIAPYRFNKDYIENLLEECELISNLSTKSSDTTGNLSNENYFDTNNPYNRRICVMGNYVDLVPLMSSCKAMIYGAGMGLTIEAAVLSTPSIKIQGFHKNHASIDLANSIGIPVVPINDISSALNNTYSPKSDIIDNGDISTNNFVDLIFKLYKNSNDFKKSGFSSLKAIWNARKEFR
ncbi:MAG: hypothetical protein ACRCVG_03175 [Methanobacteriaceae archaeon]